MITLVPTSEQQQIVDSVVDVLKTRCSVDRLRNRAAPPGALEKSEWAHFAELGWFGLGLPESAGGIGCSVAEETLLFRELGRYLLSPAVLATSLAAHVAMQGGQPELARALVAGSEKAALALPCGQPAEQAIGANGVRGEFQVVDRLDARWLVAWSDEGAALLPLEGLSRLQAVDPVDTSMTLERGTSRGAAPVAFVSGAVLPTRARLLLAAQMVGMSEATRDLAAEYAKVREQFGKPIGSFQAVGHHCANMAVRSEAAWVQAKFAALAVQDERSDAAFQVSAANLLAMEAAFQNATMAIRVHGAMGFTADCPVHHFLKRTLVLRRAAGGTHFHANRLVAEPAAV